MSFFFHFQKKKIVEKSGFSIFSWFFPPPILTFLMIYSVHIQNQHLHLTDLYPFLFRNHIGIPSALSSHFTIRHPCEVAWDERMRLVQNYPVSFSTECRPEPRSSQWQSIPLTHHTNLVLSL